MSRAIVLIGVKKTQGSSFATLQGVEDAVDRMEEWSKDQGIKHIIRITDASAPITVQDIKTRIFDLIEEQDDLTQLIIYFSGHGVVNKQTEYWLLSGAPLDSSEAVNVSGSMGLAAAGTIPHVVFISDACRTATNNVQAGRIDGANILPNDPSPDAQRDVDIFYATRLGTPALEVADGAEQYVAIYTEMLTSALNGKDKTLIKDGYIRPRPLKEWLKLAVPKALADRNLPGLVSQSPEAVVSSADNGWIAEFAAPADGHSEPVVNEDRFPMPAGAEPPQPRAPSPTSPRPIETPIIRSAEAVKLLIGDAIARTGNYDKFLTPRAVMVHTGRELSEGARTVLKPPSEEEATWKRLDQVSGFVVVGGGLRKATRREGGLITRDNVSHISLELENDLAPSVEVLIEFDGGQGTLLPSLRGYVGVIQLREGVIEQIRYEPSKRGYIEPPSADIQLLRSAFYTASKMGALDLDPSQAAELGQKLQSSKFLDPALAIYAAYAYHSIGKLERIRQMAKFLSFQEIRLLDVSLLAREFLKESDHSHHPLSSHLPILAQGWALIDAFYPTFPESLKPLRKHVGNSLFSQYDAAGMRILEAWMMTDALQAVPPITA